MNNPLRLWKLLAIIFAIIGCVSFFATLFNPAYFNTSLKIDTELASEFGTFFGGYVGTIFSILSVILLIYTINVQINDRRKDEKERKKDEVKSNFFKMLDYHNENVRHLKIPNLNDNHQDVKSEGRQAFVMFRIQMKRLINLIEEMNKENTFGLLDPEIADIAYTFLYYGLDDGNEWKDFLEEKLKREYKNHEKIFLKALEKVKKYQKMHLINLGRTNQTSLSAYFGNMYSAIKLIDDNKDLSDIEKKDLIEIYRVQLSNPELYILFSHLMSQFGEKWKNKNYIVKYEFIKNLPKGYCDKCEPKVHFSMTYEYEEMCTTTIP